LGFVDVLDLVTFLSLANQSAGSQYGDVVHVNVTCMALIGIYFILFYFILFYFILFYFIFNFL